MDSPFFRKPPPGNPRVRKVSKQWFDCRENNRSAGPATGVPHQKTAPFLFWWIFIALFFVPRKKPSR